MVQLNGNQAAAGPQAGSPRHVFAEWADEAGVIVVGDGKYGLVPNDADQEKADRSAAGTDTIGAANEGQKSGTGAGAGTGTGAGSGAVAAPSPCALAFGRLALKLPAFKRGVYYRAFHKYPERPLGSEDWLNGANRLQAQEFGHAAGGASEAGARLADDGAGGHDFAGLADGGLMMTLELMDGRCMTLLPLVGRRSAAWFSFADGQVFVSVGHMGTGIEEEPGARPVLAYAIADHIYAANYEVWRLGLAHPLAASTARLRTAKHYPDVFRYLGWCSWEEYFFTINERKLLEVIDGIDASPVPIRYLLIDDGHQHHERSGELSYAELNSPTFDGMMKARLISFAPNERFPGGWTKVMERVRSSSVQWIGLWLNFNGYWGGIHPDNELELEEHLVELQDGNHKYLLPKEGEAHAAAFYSAYLNAQREAGFDFLKIDQQAAGLEKYRRGGAGNPVACAAGNAQAMDAASARLMQTHINCMAHNAVAIFHTRTSAVTRCSEDYKKGDKLWAKRHIHNSFATIPVLGHTVWGDHDMFHSNDPAAAEAMSISKALSGGPVYLSDAPEQFRTAVIEPLIYADGELLRPLAPGVPLPDSIMDDPVTSRLAYGVIAPLEHRTAAIALFNLTEPAVRASRNLSAADYRWAGAMQQPPELWDIPEEGLVLYDWHERKAVLMNGPVSYSLDDFGVRLFLMCPVRSGWAAIGRPDKYLSAAAVRLVRAGLDELVVSLREPGEFLFWSRSGILSCTAGTLTQLDTNLWRLRTERRDSEESIVIRRGG